MAQVPRVEPAGAAKVDGGRARGAFGHTLGTSPRRSETRSVANSLPSAPSQEMPCDLREGDCGLCELKPPGA